MHEFKTYLKSKQCFDLGWFSIRMIGTIATAIVLTNVLFLFLNGWEFGTIAVAVAMVLIILLE